MKTKSAFYKLILFAFLLLVISPFSSVSKTSAHALNSGVLIQTNDYLSGEWTNKDVIITVNNQFNTDKVSYSLNSSEYIPYTQPIVFNESGHFFLEVIYLDGIVIREYITINIDKDPPVIDRVELSSEQWTTEPITLFVIIEDSLDHKHGYRAFFKDDEVKPDQTNNVIMFSYQVHSNKVFEVGEIVIFDQVGNKTIYDKAVEISNIDNVEPNLSLTLLPQKNKDEQEIKLEMPSIISGAKRLYVTTPSGEEHLLNTESKEQTFQAKQNGVYVFTVISGTDLSHSKAIIVNTVGKNSLTTPLLIIVFVLTAFVVLLVLGRFYTSKNLRQVKKKRIKRKR